MKVPLKYGWKAKVSIIKLRVYPVGNKNQQVVDKTFDKIHCLGHLKFTIEYTPFSFLIFIVWKPNAKDKKKKQSSSRYTKVE